MKKLVLTLTVVLLMQMGLTNAMAAAPFKEYPAGEEKVVNAMNIAAVYLKPINMEHTGGGMGLPASQADIHLEADIHAVKGNPNGFGAGEWIPYLTINYKLKNLDTGKEQSGSFMPMIAKDGPHYGSNIKMFGPGNYLLTYAIESPAKQGLARHTDEETGVGAWFQPFSVEYKFTYVPIAK